MKWAPRILVDLAGRRFGRLSVLSYAGQNAKFSSLWRCRCDCGNERVFTGDRLSRIVSCGCYLAERRLARCGAEAAAAKERALGNYIPEPMGGCWLWLGPYNKKGYGARRNGTAHRFFWTEHRGPILNGAHVLHKCDVRACVNPNHLYLGTHADNMRDMSSRKRCGNQRLVTFNGKTDTIRGWSVSLGLGPSVLYDRLRRGWPLEEALAVPRLRPAVRDGSRSVYTERKRLTLESSSYESDH